MPAYLHNFFSTHSSNQYVMRCCVGCCSLVTDLIITWFLITEPC